MPPPAPSAWETDTPLLPAPLPSSTESRATLTVLTGVKAGHVVAIGATPVLIGRTVLADLVVDDPGVSRDHARVVRTSAGGYYVEDLGSTNGTFVGSERVGVSALHQGDLLRLGPELRIRFAITDEAEESLHRRLYESSLYDALTHVFSRKYLGDRLVAEIAHARRASGDTAVLMIDVDCLKEVNDRFGHLAGDRALCTVTARILRSMRVEDVLARYGGDEFVVLAIGAGVAEAAQLAERVRRAVEGLNMSARGQEVRLTISIGVASLREIVASDDGGGVLLELADARLYCAKAAGRNRVCAISVPSSPVS
jgi:two-component system cell cycle response regulator